MESSGLIFNLDEDAEFFGFTLTLFQNQTNKMQSPLSSRFLSSLAAMDDLVSAADKDLLSTVEMKPELLRMNADMKVGFLGNNRDGCMKCFPPLPPPRFDLPDTCGLCKDPLGQNMDIYMYSDTPFCSKACRKAQMDIDEARERNRILLIRSLLSSSQPTNANSATSLKKGKGSSLSGREKEVLT